MLGSRAIAEGLGRQRRFPAALAVAVRLPSACAGLAPEPALLTAPRSHAARGMALIRWLPVRAARPPAPGIAPRAHLRGLRSQRAGARQEAQRDTVAAFESFMGACLAADWARDKRALFDAALPDSALPAPAGQLVPGGYEPSYGPTPIRAPGAMPGAALQPRKVPLLCCCGPSRCRAGQHCAARSRASSAANRPRATAPDAMQHLGRWCAGHKRVRRAGVDGSAGVEGLSGRARGYLEVVRELNRAQAAREGFDAAERFRAAAAAEPAGWRLARPLENSRTGRPWAWLL